MKKILWVTIILISSIIYCFTLDNGSIFYNQEKIKTNKGIVFVDNLLLRPSPELNTKPIDKLKTGDIVTILSSTENKVLVRNMLDYWYEIEINNKKGFVFGFYLSEYYNEFIIKNEKVGKILILNNKKEVLNTLNYKSFIQTSLYRNEKNIPDSEEITFEEVEIMNDKIIIKKERSCPEIPSGHCIFNKYEIINKNSDVTLTNKGYPYIFFSDLYNYLIVNIEDKNKSEMYNTYYTNEVFIYDYFGKQIKKIELDLSYKYKEFTPVYNEHVFFNEEKNKFIWIKTSKVIIVDMKELKAKYLDFKFKNMNLGEDGFIDIEEIKNIKDKLYIKLTKVLAPGNAHQAEIMVNLNKDKVEKIIYEKGW